jgi:hypothetical protein
MNRSTFTQSLVFIVLSSIVGCASQYSSFKPDSYQTGDGREAAQIIVTSPQRIMAFLLDIVEENFPGANIRQKDPVNGKLLFEYRGDFPRGDVFVSIGIKYMTGTTEAGTEIGGYSIDITSKGMGFNSSMFPGYAVTKIKEALPDMMQKYGLIFTRIKNPQLQQYVNQNAAEMQAITTIKGEMISPPATKSDVDELPRVEAKINKKAYAIVIGIEQYRQNLSRAGFATHDALTVTNYLAKVLGYPEENIITLTNEHAALGDFVKYFEKWLSNNIEKGSTVFVYYSGHGAPNPKTGDAYLVPYDGDPTFVVETGYSLKRMYEALGNLPAKEVIVALDSCFSGAGGRSVIAKGSRPLVMNFQSNVVLPKNMMVLSASSGDQVSSTYDEKGHGLFTYFLLKGIKNEDVVRSDGSLKIDDLYDYIKPQVERIARKQYNNEQTPQLFGPKKN